MGAIADFIGGLMCVEGDTICQGDMLKYEEYIYIGIIAIVAIVVLIMVMKMRGGGRPEMKLV